MTISDFSNSELERYSRQLLLKGVGGNGQRCIRKTTVFVDDYPSAPWSIAYLVAAGIGCIELMAPPQFPLANLEDAAELNADCKLVLVNEPMHAEVAIVSCARTVAIERQIIVESAGSWVVATKKTQRLGHIGGLQERADFRATSGIVGGSIAALLALRYALGHDVCGYYAVLSPEHGVVLQRFT